MWNKLLRSFRPVKATPVETQPYQWTLLCVTSQYVQAAMVEGKLQENGIPVQVLNKQDSMYPVLGEMELYVPIHLRELAISVMNEALRN
jgi:hypothetical protein